MIYHKSDQPIILKKISLKIWSFRTQIEAIIKCIKDKGVTKIPYDVLCQIINQINEDLLLKDHFPELRNPIKLEEYISKDETEENKEEEKEEKEETEEKKEEEKNCNGIFENETDDILKPNSFNIFLI